jgi:hypothetical protein
VLHSTSGQIVTQPPTSANLRASIYCAVSFLQGVFPGQFHSRELFVAVMKGFGSFGVLDKRVVAFPLLVRLLMHLHFDFYAFVDGLNHDGVLLDQ